jgi:MFS family permease
VRIGRSGGKPERIRRRDFALLWSASAISQLGNVCSATANPLLALLLTHSPIFAGWVGAASTIPALLMHLPAGWLVDRCNRRLLMFIGQAGRLVAGAMLVWALWSGDQSTIMIIIVVSAICEGAFLVLYNAAEITAVQRVVNSVELPAALALNEARVHIAVIAGKPLGGFLLELNRALPYCVNMVGFIWSFVALIGMKKKDYQPPYEARPRNVTSIIGVVKEVVQHSFLRTVIIVCALGNFCFQIIVLSLLVLAQQQHMSGILIGLLLATSGIGGLAGSMIAPRVRRHVKHERNLIGFCVAAWAGLTLVIALYAHPVVGLIAWGGLSITGGFLNVAVVTYQVREVPGHMLGRVMAVNRFVTSGAVPLGAMTAGYVVAELQPAGAAWWVFIAIALMAGVNLAKCLPAFATIAARASAIMIRFVLRRLPPVGAVLVKFLPAFIAIALLAGAIMVRLLLGGLLPAWLKWRPSRSKPSTPRYEEIPERPPASAGASVS